MKTIEGYKLVQIKNENSYPLYNLFINKKYKAFVMYFKNEWVKQEEFRNELIGIIKNDDNVYFYNNEKVVERTSHERTVFDDMMYKLQWKSFCEKLVCLTEKEIRKNFPYYRDYLESTGIGFSKYERINL